MAFDWKRIVGLYGPAAATGESAQTGLGPDFPESAGDREKGKFRPSAYPRLTQVAVTNDDGTPVGASASSLEDERLLELKAIRLGIEFMLAEFNAKWAGIDLREIVVTE